MQFCWLHKSFWRFRTHMIWENVHYFPQWCVSTGLCSYQNIIFHPQQILSNTDTWPPLPLKHTESVHHTPWDHSRHHLQTGRTPSDYFQTSEEKMGFHILGSTEHSSPSFLKVWNRLISTEKHCWPASYSHIFPFLCFQQIFSLKEVFVGQTTLGELINKF